MKEVAIFGGTFDPPTLAHETIIAACLERDDIDEVIVMPSGQRADKPQMSSNDTRLKMLQAVKAESFGNNEKLIISDLEMCLPQPTTTISTYRELLRNFPGKRFWFVFGADSYQDMPNWQEGEFLQATLGMLLVPRAGHVVPVDRPNVKLLGVEMGASATISSTEIREGLQNGTILDEYLSPAVQGCLADTCAHNHLRV